MIALFDCVEIRFRSIKEVVKMFIVKLPLGSQEIPGAKEEECGNYTFMDLAEAKKAANYFVNR